VTAQKTVAGFAKLIAMPTLITMGIAGIWHGAGSQFVIFGVLHGVYITVNHAWRLWRPKSVTQKSSVAGLVASTLLTYLCVLVGQVFFRANSTHDAGLLIESLCGLRQGSRIGGEFTPVLLIIILFPIVWFMPNTQELLNQVPYDNRSRSVFRYVLQANSWTWAAAVGVLFVFALLFTSNTATFLYFQF